MSMREQLRLWWRGKLRESRSDFHNRTYYQRPLLARLLIALWRFWLRNWVPLVTIAVALAAYLSP